MAKRYTDEFRRDAVRIATTSGLTRPQLSSDLGVGLSTLNKWVQQHQHDDLMSGPHEDVEKENTRLRKKYGCCKRSIRLGQAAFSAHFLLSRNRAFARTSSLRMTAVMATFFSFPAVTS